MARGRPRKTEPEKALHEAMLIFWEKGYDAASMNDLVEATGMAKPGLYATFGDKQEIYKKALEHYVSSRGSKKLALILESKKSAKETFKIFFGTLIDGMCDPQTPQGCFLVNTLTKSENEEPSIRELAVFFNQRRKMGFLQYLKRAQSEGNLSKDNDVEQLADFLSAQVLTLAVLHKTGSDRGELERFVESVLVFIKE